MRRMKRLLHGSSSERGGVAVIVAVMIVALLGIGAIVVDVGNAMWERRMLQNSADAAALAAAQDIAGGESEGTAETTAVQYADDNNRRGAYVDGFEYDEDEGTVEVVTRTGDTESSGVLAPFLAQVFATFDDEAEGSDQTYFARARAVASVTAPLGGEALPLTFGLCEWAEFTGTEEDDWGGDDPEEWPDDPNFPDSETVIFDTDSSEPDECKGPAGQNYPGGFGTLENDECIADIRLTEEGLTAEVDGSPGASGPGSGQGADCEEEEFKALVESTDEDNPLLVPIFRDKPDDQGQDVTYEIMGFAAFNLTGYNFRGGGNWTYEGNDGPTECGDQGQSDSCITGSFTDFVDLDTANLDGEGRDFGAQVVVLEE